MTGLACKEPTRAQFNYLRHKLAVKRAKYVSQDELLCILLDNYDYCELEKEEE